MHVQPEASITAPPASRQLHRRMERMELLRNTFLTVQELAQLLKVKVSWIYDRTRCTGPELIPHVRFGRQIRFHLESEDFQSWITAHAITVRPAIDSGEFEKYVQAR